MEKVSLLPDFFGLLLLSIAKQDSHLPHGFSEIPSLHNKDFANILAIVVLPTPLGPQKRYAWAI